MVTYKFTIPIMFRFASKFAQPVCRHVSKRFQSTCPKKPHTTRAVKVSDIAVAIRAQTDAINQINQINRTSNTNQTELVDAIRSLTIVQSAISMSIAFCGGVYISSTVLGGVFK